MPSIIGADDVADQTLAHLRTWMPTYLADVARGAGLDATALPEVDTWDIQTAGQRNPEWKAPAVSVVPIALDQVKPGSREGTMHAGFLTQVNTYVESTGDAACARLSGRYIKALRAALTSQPTLGGFAYATQFVTETYVGLGVTDSRFRGGAAVAVRIWIADVIDNRGFDAPAADPAAGVPEPPLHTSSTVSFDL